MKKPIARLVEQIEKLVEARIPADTPEEVKSVAELAIKSAKKAGLRDDTVFVSKVADTWSISDNYERFSSMVLVFRDGKWFYRELWSDMPNKLIKGGQAEAESNAELMFTGLMKISKIESRGEL